MHKFLAFLFSLFLGAISLPAFADGTPPTTPPSQTPPAPPAPPQEGRSQAAELARLRRENADLKSKLEGKAGDPPTPPEDPLIHKTREQQRNVEEQKKEARDIEKALAFNMGTDRFLSENKDLLPSEINGIIANANKETYDNARSKAGAIKSAIIQSYFGVAANREALTENQKNQLDDYLKLTKTGKETKAAEIYENIFEPTLETVRKIKKAEEVGRSRSGLAPHSDQQTAYKDRLVANSKKAYLGEKEQRA